MRVKSILILKINFKKVQLYIILRLSQIISCFRIFFIPNHKSLYNTNETLILLCPHEINSVGMDNAYYMQGPRFESRPPQKKH